MKKAGVFIFALLMACAAAYAYTSYSSSNDIFIEAARGDEFIGRIRIENREDFPVIYEMLILDHETGDFFEFTPKIIAVNPKEHRYVQVRVNVPESYEGEHITTSIHGYPVETEMGRGPLIEIKTEVSITDKKAVTPLAGFLTFDASGSKRPDYSVFIIIGIVVLFFASLTYIYTAKRLGKRS